MILCPKKNVIQFWKFGKLECCSKQILKVFINLKKIVLLPKSVCEGSDFSEKIFRQALKSKDNMGPGNLGG